MTKDNHIIKNFICFIYTLKQKEVIQTKLSVHTEVMY